MVHKLTIGQKAGYVETYRLARETVGNSYLIPERTEEDIINNQLSDKGPLASWLNFSPVNSLKEVASSVNPNVWCSKFATRYEIGLHFNSKESLNKIENILRNTEKTELKDELRVLDDTWETILERKVKEYCAIAPPDYEAVVTRQTNQLDDNDIVELFAESRRIYEVGKIGKQRLRKGNKYYPEAPVLDLVRCIFPRDDEEFRNRILIAHRIMEMCYRLQM